MCQGKSAILNHISKTTHRFRFRSFEWVFTWELHKEICKLIFIFCMASNVLGSCMMLKKNVDNILLWLIRHCCSLVPYSLVYVRRSTPLNYILPPSRTEIRMNGKQQEILWKKSIGLKQKTRLTRVWKIYALSWHETMIKRRVKFVVNEQRSRRKRIGMLQATCDASQATRHIKRTSDLFCIQRSTGGSVPHWLYNSRLNTIQSTANVQIVLYLLHFNDNIDHFNFRMFFFFCVAPHSKLIEYLFVIPVIDYLLCDDLNIFLLSFVEKTDWLWIVAEIIV